MLCNHCQAKTDVIDSRIQEDGSVKRRRECVVCKMRFSSREVRLAEPVRAPVVKVVPVKKIVKSTARVAQYKGSSRKEKTYFNDVEIGSNYEDIQDIGFQYPRNWSD